MSIGISFMGYDGKKRSMTAQALSDVQNFMSQNEDDDDEENLTEEEKKRRKRGRMSSFLSTMRNVAKHRNKRTKKQDEQKRKKEVDDLKKKVAELEKEVKQKKSEEEDDPVDGPVVGKTNNSDVEPDGESRSVGSAGGFRIAVSRTEMTKGYSAEMECDMVTFVKLEYDLIFSQKGYLKGRSTERKVWEQSFYVKAEDGGGGFGVYPVFANGVLASLNFGDEASLKSRFGEGGKGIMTVRTQTCTQGVTPKLAKS